MKNYYTITQLTKEFNISTRTLRFYEDEGLLQPERRGRTRIYSVRDRHNLVKILQARCVGFKITEIARLIKLNASLPDTVQELRTTMEEVISKRQELRDQRRALETMIDELDNLEDACLTRLAEIGVPM